MPSAPKRPCKQSGCAALVERGYCDKHKRPESRPSRSKRGYTQHWYDHIRPAILIRDNYTCQICGVLVGQIKRDAHVDHIDNDGPDEAWNLRTLCHSCHSRKTVTEDMGR